MKRPEVRISKKNISRPSIVMGATTTALTRAGIPLDSFREKIKSLGGNSKAIIEYCSRRVKFIEED
jgi:hypothetical protein